MDKLKKIMENPLARACIIGIGVFIIIIIIILCITSCSGNKKYSYTELETKLVALAKDHYAKDSDGLPKENGDMVTISAQTFINEGKIKPINEIVENHSVCTAEVNIYNNNGFYLYLPQLDCGKDYVSKTLYDILLNEDNIVTSGNGLYSVGSEFIFKGDSVKNFVKLGDILYRVIKINDDGSIRVIDTTRRDSTPWDDRYNKDRDTKDGINDYVINDINSRIKDTLEATYNDEELFSEDIKSFFVPKTLCVGKRSLTDGINDGTLECLDTIENQVFGLIQANEFYNASLDANCSVDLPEACLNYNYIKDIGTTWTITADRDSSHKVFRINYDGIGLSTARNSIGYKIVTTLNKNVIIESGTGSEEDPYVINTYIKK